MKTVSVEQTILYLILVNDHLIAECDLSPDDFTQKTDQIIFEAMQAVAREQKPVDIITVGEYLEQRYRTVDMAYLGSLIEKGVGTSSRFGTYCDMIKEQSRKRKARNIAFTLQTAIEENLPGNHVETAIRELMAIDQVSKKHDHTFKDVARAAVEHVEQVFNSGGLAGITTGFNELDEAIGGYKNTDLVVICARPAMGKTAMLLSTYNRCGVSAGIISAEQDMMQIGQRLISIAGSVNSQNLRTAKLNESEWSKLSAGTLQIQNREGGVNDKSGITINEVISQARKWKFEKDIKILYVDYIQKIKGSNPRASKKETVAEVASSLKNLAKELQIPVVALAQVSRSCESRPDKRPTMGDLADAAEIEMEADVIMTLYRDEVYNPQTQFPGIAELGLVKNRHGPIGTLRVKFIGKYFQFEDFSNVKDIQNYR